MLKRNTAWSSDVAKQEMLRQSCIRAILSVIEEGEQNDLDRLDNVIAKETEQRLLRGMYQNHNLIKALTIQSSSRRKRGSRDGYKLLTHDNRRQERTLNKNYYRQSQGAKHSEPGLNNKGNQG